MNLAQVLSDSCSKYKEKPAIVFEGRSYSFNEIDEEVRKCSLWLHKAGIQKGDRIAIQLPKSTEFIFLHLAVLSLGGISLPLNPDYSPEEVTYYLSDSGTSLFFTDSTRFERARSFLDGMEGLRIYLMDQAGPEGTGPLPIEWEKAGTGDQPAYPAQDDDVAMMLYTSGTTGRSKGAMITHRNLVSNMIALKQAWEWTDQDVLLHVLPLFHVHGLCVALQGGLYAGSTIIMHEKFDPRETWKTIAEERCSILMGVPTIYHRLLNEYDHLKPDLSSMRVFICGSAPLSESLFIRFEKTTGFRILERYGMTEAGMIISNLIDPSGRKAKSVGHPLPGVRARIVTESGKDVKSGEVGEVWIKGDNVFKGYWQMPEKTRDSFEDGWFKTGDLGYQDPEDSMRFYLAGRAKELIITGGYNVYPKEVENVLEHHEAVQEAAVIGLPDEDYGEKVTAVVVLKKDPSRTPAEDILAFCRKHLAGYKCPKEVFTVDQLPRNSMGKIQKDLLQKRYSKPAA